MWVERNVTYLNEGRRSTMSEYSAVVCKIKTQPHPNADRIQLGLAKGYQVIIGLDVKDGDLGVLFPPDGQLSEEFCAANDLIGYVDPGTKERKGGFFSKKRRVRAQRFRGEKSDGFFCPLSFFDFTEHGGELKEDEEIITLGGIEICKKYITPATMRSKNGPKRNRKHNPCFAKHYDTEQFKRASGKILPRSLITITEKCHGTSGRTGNVWDVEDKNLPTYQQVWNKITPRFMNFSTKKMGYVVLTGSRNVVLSEGNIGGYYAGDNFRRECMKDVNPNIRKGEVIYYEILGYTMKGGHIMASSPYDKLKDAGFSSKDVKEYKKMYGETCEFSYGCQPEALAKLPQYRVMVYRITQVNVDGNVIELSWNQVKARCKELMLETVPQIGDQFMYRGSVDVLREILDLHVDGTSEVDSRHIKEGVVCRAEMPDGTTIALKYKSHVFLAIEGCLKAQDDYVDTEESA